MEYKAHSDCDDPNGMFYLCSHHYYQKFMIAQYGQINIKI